MKKVTIDTVRERIAELEMVNSHGELSLRGEFELACLRMLADSMGGVDDDVRNVVALLENNEWAEHCTKTDLGQRLESEITRLVGHVQPSQVVTVASVVPDEMTPEMMRAVQLNSELGAYAVSNLSGAYDLFSEFWKVARSAAMLKQSAPFIVTSDHRMMEMPQVEDINAVAAMLHGAEQSPVTDNTAQQFEALAASGKSEHLLNAERIAREAKALSDRLNATSAVHHRVSGWSERQQKVIAYSLWRFSCTAYQQANQAAQTNNKDMFDRFIRDARCAEEIREEFTSEWSGKL